MHVYILCFSVPTSACVCVQRGQSDRRQTSIIMVSTTTGGWHKILVGGIKYWLIFTSNVSIGILKDMWQLSRMLTWQEYEIFLYICRSAFLWALFTYALMLNIDCIQPYAHSYIHRSDTACTDEPTSSYVLQMQEPTAAWNDSRPFRTYSWCKYFSSVSSVWAQGVLAGSTLKAKYSIRSWRKSS